MECISCAEKLKQELVTYSLNTSNGIFIIKDVPALVCSLCSENYFEHEVFLKLEHIVRSLKSQHDEIVIISFSDLVL